MPYAPSAAPELELWGGIECTVNRVGDQYVTQLERNGHHERIGDLDLVAGLGLRTLRYPVLWERTAPDGLECADWSWPDVRLARLTELGIDPIVGLLHHGSGPRSTNLLDPAFPEKLAEYAGAVAARYPWVTNYTPVNEPLTTARFSALYGHWYPHGRDELTFLRALLNQCRGVVLAMRAIRRVNPAARLVQTDDLGHTHSTPTLAYQAEYENERRWLSWDLLCGRIDARHPLWRRLRRAGLGEGELTLFLREPCLPDVIGVNYYLFSERYIDERLEYFPAHAHGGNGRHAYADVEALRAPVELAGPGRLLSAAWERYRLPIAVTEAHLNAPCNEQIRWLLEMWRGARAARAAGADVRAVTVWSLFGAFDWTSLCTVPNNFYESGVFDVRDGTPRPTALAGVVRALARGREPAHAALRSPGWWRRPERVIYGPVGRASAA